MRVAGVEAGGYGSVGTKVLDQFRHLLERAAERMFRARGIFDEDVKWRLLPGQAVDGLWMDFAASSRPCCRVIPR